MKFGIQLDISVPRPFEAEVERQAFDHTIEQAVRADALGFDYCWLGERHFLEEFSHSPAPDVVLAAIAAKTKHIRLGASVLAAPLGSGHPSAIAERAAVLDLVSEGRVDLALGQAVSWAELGAFGGDRAQAGAAWDELVHAIPQMWTKSHFAHEGAHFSMPERAVLPKPCQKPHPPLWAGVDTPGGEVAAGERGLGAQSRVVGDLKDQAAKVAAYRDAVRSAKPAGAFVNDRIAALNLLYCHEGERDGSETAQRFVSAWREVAAQQVWSHEVGLGRGGPALRHSAELPQGLAVGDPKSIIDVLKAWEATGTDCVNFILNVTEAVPQSDVLASLELFAAEVMPVFNRQRARAAAE